MFGWSVHMLNVYWPEACCLRMIDDVPSGLLDDLMLRLHLIKMILLFGKHAWLS